MMVVAGCVVPTREEPSYRPSYPDFAPPPAQTSGGLYQVGYGVSLFSDDRADSVGDIVTIRLEESTSASKSAETSISKDNVDTVIEPTILGSVVTGSGTAGLLSDIDNEHTFDGEADSSQNNRLSGTVSAVVTAVYPNGLMLVQGEKWLNLNQGEEFIRISGLVRGADIEGTNVVSSLRLADARIAYSGTGALADGNTPNWLSRFFLNPINPF